MWASLSAVGIIMKKQSFVKVFVCLKSGYCNSKEMLATLQCIIFSKAGFSLQCD